MSDMKLAFLALVLTLGGMSVAGYWAEEEERVLEAEQAQRNHVEMEVTVRR